MKGAVVPSRGGSWVIAVLLTFAWSVAPAITKDHKEIPPRSDVVPDGGAAPVEQTVAATHVFDDAVLLKTWIAQNNAAGVVALLKAYGIDVSKIKTTPFLNRVSYFSSKGFIESQGGAPSQLAEPEGLSLSGLGAGQVADALGSLIAERFKQEAEMEALHTLGVKILELDCKYPLTPLAKALPTTVRYLQTLEIPPNAPCTSSIQLRPVDVNDWAVLQSSFKVDVAALPDNLPIFLDALYGNSDKLDLRYLTWLSATSAGQIYKNGHNPYQIIDTAVSASDAFWKLKNLQDDGSLSVIPDVDVGLRVLSILSHMLTKDGASQWHSVRELKQFLQIENCARNCDSVFLLLGLSYARDRDLYQEIDLWLQKRNAHTIEEIDAGALGDQQYFAILQNFMSQTLALANTLESVYQHVHDIPAKLTSLSEARPLVDDLGAVAIEASGVIQAIRQMRIVSESELALMQCGSGDSYCDIRNSIRATTRELDYAFEIVGDIRTQQYGAAVGELIAYIEIYRESHKVACLGSGEDCFGKLGTFFTDHGAFIAAVAAAHSTDDLKAALDNYSLPAGSYTQQQGSRFSVTLNSFFGVALSAETLTGSLSGTNVARTRTRAGFAAPVGLDFNFGRVLDKTQPRSGRFFDTGAWSLFVPVLDVGAVASWRLGSGGGSVSAITWQNIVAPGLYAVWSKRDSPLSILFGAQYGPELRKVSAGGNTIEKAAIQFPCLEFTFNIPIFNLYR